MKHLLTLKDLDKNEMRELIELAADIKKNPVAYVDAMKQKTLLMIFEKPSLRTRVSFEAGMTRMGGHAIYYDTHTSPMGSGKESVHDTVKVSSRFVDGIMARLFEHDDIEKMAAASDVPVINGLTNFNHPCQIMADLLTITEAKGSLQGLTLAYLGDANNNVTHSLMYGCARMGMHVRIGCPDDVDYLPMDAVLQDTQAIASANGTELLVTADPAEAVRGADVVYTDTWMSYHINKEQLEKRLSALQPFQVNETLMAQAAKGAIFMNCLPAMRGFEQTAEVIDGPASVVFDQAGNRMWAQNAILVKLMG